MTEQQGAQEQQVRTAITPAPAAPLAPTMQVQRGGGVRRILALNGLAVLVLLLIGLAIFYLWHQGYYFYTTDDAAVTGTIVTVAAPAPVTIARVYHGLGGQVQAGETIAALRTVSGATLGANTPIKGTIISEGATLGEVLPAGQTVAQLVDLGALSITAYVEENHIGDVSLGQGVDVTIDAVKDTTFHGHVTGILPATASMFSALPTTDKASGNFTKVTERIPVEISLNGYEGHSLFPGESAAVTIHIHN